MYYFFVNPASRSGKGQKKWGLVEAYLKEHAIPYEVHFLEAEVSPRPVMEAIFEKEKEAPVSIVLIGGDGTVNQCVNGIPDFDRAELSVIPTGSGNDFCRNKHFPKSLEAQLNNIFNRKHIRLVDRGVNTYTCRSDRAENETVTRERTFLVSTGIGYDAEICESANKSRLKKILNRIKLGKLVYLAIGVKGIFSANLTDMTVTIDGETKEYSNVFFVAMMNQPFEGGGVAMTPAADDCDGIMDYIIVHGISRFKALCTIPLLYIRKHEGKRGVTLLTGKDIRLSTSAPRTMHTDGEDIPLCTELHVRFEGKVKLVH